MRTALPIVLTASEVIALRRQARRTAGRAPLRARIVLLAALGWDNRAIAEKLDTDPHTVARWRSRFASGRLAGIERDARRAGRRPRVRDAAKRHILRLTRQFRRQKRPCTSRRIAKLLGVNHMLVYRVWKDAGIKP